MIDELDRIVMWYNEGGAEKLQKLQERLSVAAAISHYSSADNLKVAEIIRDVADRGDDAVTDYTERFDGIRIKPSQFRISPGRLNKAGKSGNRRVKTSLRQAIKNVRQYQQQIFTGRKRYPQMRYTPLQRVGICVPGASAPLPSTLIMSAVPAQVAGVKEIVVVSPPRFNRSIHPVILGVCAELGIEEVYRVGGAQAVAALALGTETIKKVDKIVGPGNRWVQMAKKQVFGAVDIDSIAGPSEVLIVANDKANPAWVAADLLSQAEHDPGSACLFTDSEELAAKVLAELKKQVKALNRSSQAINCLLKYGAILVFSDMDEVIEQANEFAAEHLQIQCGSRSKKIAAAVKNAGAIFVGDYTPVAVGDYWAGPSHTLPTGQTAKFFSPLSVNDFVKATSVIEYDKKKLSASAADIIRLAQVEGLDAHANSVRIRSDK